MRTFVIFITVLLLLYSSTTAGSLAYYPWERPSKKELQKADGLWLFFSAGAAIETSEHIHKLFKLSKRPLLLQEDVRGLKRRSIFMPIFGAYQIFLGVVSINWAQDELNTKVRRVFYYCLSATWFVGAGLSFVDAKKSHEVLSKYNSQK